MRWMLLTPGTGHFYCGSCLRDHVLGNALRRRGHDVDVVSLYLPRVLEDGETSEPVHMGGINMYLQQKSRLAGRLPRWMTRWLDRPGLLRWASRRSSMTDAADLGALTTSMLAGEEGRQAAELERLVEALAAGPKPDVVLLSNMMLVGVVRRLKDVLGCPVVCTLQGEAPFLDALPEPHRGRAWQLVGERLADVETVVAVSAWYGAHVRERLGLPEGRVRTVWNGLEDPAAFAAPTPAAERRPPTIGYLARQCRDKGLHTLVDAFIRMKSGGAAPELRLRVAGAMLPEDVPFVEELQRRLGEAGLRDEVEFLPNVTRAEKIAALAGLSVFSVPATYGESFGLYVLEALAAGVPVVQPRHGAFPELIEATGGGVLCAADDAEDLATKLADVIAGRAGVDAERGRACVAEHFTADRMARDFEELVKMLTSS